MQAGGKGRRDTLWTWDREIGEQGGRRRLKQEPHSKLSCGDKEAEAISSEWYVPFRKACFTHNTCNSWGFSSLACPKLNPSMEAPAQLPSPRPKFPPLCRPCLGFHLVLHDWLIPTSVLLWHLQSLKQTLAQRAPLSRNLLCHVLSADPTPLHSLPALPQGGSGGLILHVQFLPMFLQRVGGCICSDWHLTRRKECEC